MLGSIVETAASFLFVDIAYDLQRRAIGSQHLGHKDTWATIAFRRFPEEFHGCLAITALRDKAF